MSGRPTVSNLLLIPMGSSCRRPSMTTDGSVSRSTTRRRGSGSQWWFRPRASTLARWAVRRTGSHAGRCRRALVEDADERASGQCAECLEVTAGPAQASLRASGFISSERRRRASARRCACGESSQADCHRGSRDSSDTIGRLAASDATGAHDHVGTHRRSCVPLSARRAAQGLPVSCWRIAA